MQLLRNPHGLADHPRVMNIGPQTVTPAKAGVQVFGAKSLSRILSGVAGFRVKPGMTLWGRRTSYFHGKDAVP